MKVRLCGDIHGLVNDFRSYVVHGCEHRVIQVGDFGVGFGQSDYWHEQVDEYNIRHDVSFIRGNHDNPSQCRDMLSWIPDGRVENDVMFIGGAWSIDNPNAPPGWYQRTEGVNWWADEQCSDEQFAQMLDVYKTVRPRIMITHDCPQRVSREMFWGSGFIKGPEYYNRTSDWFNQFFEAHQPDLWVYGHWHKTMQHKTGNTTFVCLNELDYMDLDLENIHQSVYEKFS